MIAGIGDAAGHQSVNLVATVLQPTDMGRMCHAQPLDFLLCYGTCNRSSCIGASALRMT